MSEESKKNRKPPPQPPLFKLDLGANGGMFAPTSVQEMTGWIRRELDFWSWTQSSNPGSHKSALDNALQPLHRAHQLANEAAQFEAQASESAVRDRIEGARNQVSEAYTRLRLPHSSTPLARRIDALKAEPFVAFGYVFANLPPINNYPFDGRDLASWRGFLAGVLDKDEVLKSAEPAIRAEREALEKLRTTGDQLLATKKEVAEGLERDFRQAEAMINGATSMQRDQWDQLLAESKATHQATLEKHDSDMKAIQDTFREAMTLRGPVEYWATKATAHESRASRLMWIAFASMAGLALLLGGLSWWAFSGFDQAKIAVLVLIAVLGIWATRLVVRMYLSHAHLATDAHERVTMVKTYLALLEAQKMPADEDRKLVLAPLFRPATDGLVKDEGLPHPMLELLTRSGSK